MLNEHLKEKHTDGDGLIMVDDSLKALRETIAIIKEEADIDYDDMVMQVLELDQTRALAEAVLTLDMVEILKEIGTLIAKTESIIKDEINHRLKTL